MAVFDEDCGSLRIHSDVPGVVTVSVRPPGSSREHGITIPWDTWLKMREIEQARLVK